MQASIPPTLFFFAGALFLSVWQGCATAKPENPSTNPASRSVSGPVSAPAPASSRGRIAVIGASVSAGFTAPPLANVLKEALEDTYRVKDFSALMMFRDPEKTGKNQVDKTLELAPDLVVAIDFLFWYAYGSGLALSDRLYWLNVGLSELERLSMPVLVGDIPDMSGADTRMLSPTAIPPPDELSALNARLGEWAALRPKVVVVPLSLWTEPLHAGGSITLFEGEPPVPAKELMAIDGLHPNRRGLVYVVCNLLELAGQSGLIATAEDKSACLQRF